MDPSKRVIITILFILFIKLFYLEIPRIGRLYTIYALGIQAKRFLGFSKYSI